LDAARLGRLPIVLDCVAQGIGNHRRNRPLPAPSEESAAAIAGEKTIRSFEALYLLFLPLDNISYDISKVNNVAFFEHDV
jgi:hypothetical protein